MVFSYILHSARKANNLAPGVIFDHLESVLEPDVESGRRRPAVGPTGLLLWPVLLQDFIGLRTFVQAVLMLVVADVEFVKAKPFGLFGKQPHLEPRP
jgi:hypothetical protein